MATDVNGPDEQPDIETGSLPSGELPDSLREQLEAAWDKREPKWYERLAPAQRHWVDKLVAIRLEEFESHLTALDREDSQLARQIAELSAQLGQLNERLAALEVRIEQVESRPADAK